MQTIRSTSINAVLAQSAQESRLQFRDELERALVKQWCHNLQGLTMLSSPSGSCNERTLWQKVFYEPLAEVKKIKRPGYWDDEEIQLVRDHIVGGISFYLALTKKFCLTVGCVEASYSKLFICHILNCLGDLSRYYCSDLRGISKEESSTALANYFSTPVLYYKQAVELCSNLPVVQSNLASVLLKDKTVNNGRILAALHYLAALTSETPFQVARVPLTSLMNSCYAEYNTQKQLLDRSKTHQNALPTHQNDLLSDASFFSNILLSVVSCFVVENVTAEEILELVVALLLQLTPQQDTTSEGQEAPLPSSGDNEGLLVVATLLLQAHHLASAELELTSANLLTAVLCTIMRRYSAKHDTLLLQILSSELISVPDDLATIAMKVNCGGAESSSSSQPGSSQDEENNEHKTAASHATATARKGRPLRHRRKRRIRRPLHCHSDDDEDSDISGSSSSLSGRNTDDDSSSFYSSSDDCQSWSGDSFSPSDGDSDSDDEEQNNNDVIGGVGNDADDDSGPDIIVISGEDSADESSPPIAFKNITGTTSITDQRPIVTIYAAKPPSTTPVNEAYRHLRILTLTDHCVPTDSLDNVDSQQLLVKSSQSIPTLKSINGSPRSQSPNSILQSQKSFKSTPALAIEGSDSILAAAVAVTSWLHTEGVCRHSVVWKLNNGAEEKLRPLWEAMADLCNQTKLDLQSLVNDTSLLEKLPNLHDFLSKYCAGQRNADETVETHFKLDKFLLPEDRFLKTLYPRFLPKHVLKSKARVVCEVLAHEFQSLGLVSSSSTTKQIIDKQSPHSSLTEAFKEKPECDVTDALSIFDNLNFDEKENQAATFPLLSSTSNVETLLPEEVTLLRVLRLRVWLLELSSQDHCPLLYNEVSGTFEIIPAEGRINVDGNDGEQVDADNKGFYYNKYRNDHGSNYGRRRPNSKSNENFQNRSSNRRSNYADDVGRRHNYPEDVSSSNYGRQDVAGRGYYDEGGRRSNRPRRRRRRYRNAADGGRYEAPHEGYDEDPGSSRPTQWDGERPSQRDGERPYQRDQKRLSNRDEERPARRDRVRPSQLDGGRPFKREEERPWQNRRRIRDDSRDHTVFGGKKDVYDDCYGSGYPRKRLSRNERRYLNREAQREGLEGRRPDKYLGKRSALVDGSSHDNVMAFGTDSKTRKYSSKDRSNEENVSVAASDGRIQEDDSCDEPSVKKLNSRRRKQLLVDNKKKVLDEFAGFSSESDTTHRPNVPSFASIVAATGSAECGSTTTDHTNSDRQFNRIESPRQIRNTEVLKSSTRQPYKRTDNSVVAILTSSNSGSASDSLEGKSYSRRREIKKNIAIPRSETTSSPSVQKQAVAVIDYDASSDDEKRKKRQAAQQQLTACWLRHELSETTKQMSSDQHKLEQEVIPVVVPDALMLLLHRKHLAAMVRQGKCVVVIARQVLEDLDEQKRSNGSARDASRWLETQLRSGDGSRYLQMQSSTQHVTVPLVNYPLSQHKVPWRWFMILECCHYLAREEYFGTIGGSKKTTSTMYSDQYSTPSSTKNSPVPGRKGVPDTVNSAAGESLSGRPTVVSLLLAETKPQVDKLPFSLYTLAASVGTKVQFWPEFKKILEHGSDAERT